MSELPPPLVPAWVDLRSYEWFPFFHKRLRQSAFWKSASDLACRVSVDLWSEAYEQVPAGSIPDNDHILSEWAGFGRRDLSGWLAAKDEVLSAWTLCADGRWYHPTLSEVARQAGVERRKHLWARECDRIRKENIRRQKAGGCALAMPPKPSDDPWVDGAFSESSVGGQTEDEGGPEDIQPASDECPAEKDEIPAENALTGTRTEILSPSLRSGDACASASPAKPVEKPPRRPPKAPTSSVDFETWYDGYPHKVGRGAAEKAFAVVMATGSANLAELVAGRDQYIRTKHPEHSWCNPATWLNQRRWLDKPATSLSTPVATASSEDPRVDLGGGIQAPYSTIRGVWEKGRWLDDWGPRPDQPGCRIPSQTMAAIMGQMPRTSRAHSGGIAA